MFSMPSKKHIITAAVLGGIIFAAVLYYRRRTGTGELQFNADPATQGGIQVKVLPYHGRYKNNPELRRVYDNMPAMVQAAVRRIKQHARTPEPDILVNIKFDDSFDNDPFIKPSLASQCPPRAYEKDKGNCQSYTILVGTEALAGRYKGRTSIQKMLTHELTHMWMLYHVKDHDRLPDYIIEGVPIHIAGQEDDILNTHRNNDKSSNYKYNPGEIPVTEYSRIINDFRTKGYMPI